MSVLRRVFTIVRDAIGAYLREEGPLSAAGVSYFALFSLFPLGLLLLATLATFLPQEATQAWLLAQAAAYAPGAETLIEANLNRLVLLRPQIGAAGLISLLWSASGGFTVLNRTLERMLGERRDASPLRARVLGIFMVLAAGALVGASVVADMVLGRFRPLIGKPPWPNLDVLPWLTNSFGFLLLTLAILLAYRLLPTGAPPLRALLPGALVAASGLALARSLFVRYINALDSYQLIYGSVGTVIVVLLWFYVSAAIFLFGAALVAAIRQTGKH